MSENITHGLQPEVCHTAAAVPESARYELEQDIRYLEFNLGLMRNPVRWAEATLFIDRVFIETAVLAGQTEGFERLFGHEEWQGYLEAGVFCDAYEDQLPTPDFLLGIHHSFLKFQAPEVAGTYAVGTYRGGAKDALGNFGPITLTPHQAQALRNNLGPLFNPTSADKLTGFIEYPVHTPQERHQRAVEICDWYKYYKNSPGHDPYRLAGEFEQRLIASHLYAFGICGRVARAAMNWSLRSAGLSPSALSDFNQDIFLEPAAWADEVKAGCARYEQMLILAQFSKIRAIDLFGLRPQAIAATPYITAHAPILESGTQLDRRQAELFIDKVAYNTPTEEWRYGYDMATSAVPIQVPKQLYESGAIRT